MHQNRATQAIKNCDERGLLSQQKRAQRQARKGTLKVSKKYKYQEQKPSQNSESKLKQKGKKDKTNSKEARQIIRK